MRTWLKRFGRELCCLLGAGILSVIVSLWVRFDGVKNPQLGSVLLIAAGINIWWLVRTFQKLWHGKWRRAMVAVLQKGFEKLVRRLSSSLEKWGIGKKRANVIGGRTSVLFDRLPSEREMRRPTVRRLRWKQLKSAGERLGYLYGHMIKRRIEQGSEYYSSDTPLQLQKREENSPVEDELFDLYIQKRYDGRTEPDEETLLRIKDEMQIK